MEITVKCVCGMAVVVLSVFRLFAGPDLIAVGGEAKNNLGAPESNRFELPLQQTWPTEDYGAEVCLWRYDRYAALSFGHDDNCDWDIPFLLRESERNGFKLTWWLITKNIGDTGSTSGSGNWPEWGECFAAGHAIESHSHTHEWHGGGRTVPDAAAAAGMSEEEYVEFCMYSNSLAIIREKIPGCKPSTLAFPGGEVYPEVANRYFVSGRSTSPYINRANAINYQSVNASSSGIDPGCINVVLGGRGGSKALSGWRGSFNDAQNYRGWLVPFQHTESTHDGLPNAGHEGGVALQIQRFELLGRHRRHLWLGTYPAIAKYGQSRDTATLTVVKKTAFEIAFTLVDQMRDDWYDEPLTVKVRLPAAWAQGGVAATQGGNALDAFYIEREGAKYALVNAVPDRGEVTLVPAAANTGAWDETSYETPTYTYQVRFYDTDGTTLLKTIIAHQIGTSAAELAPVLYKPGYKLSWTTADGVSIDDITDDVDFTAAWTVTDEKPRAVFVDENGATLTTVETVYGTRPVQPTDLPVREGYIAYWEPDLGPIISNTQYMVKYMADDDPIPGAIIVRTAEEFCDAMANHPDAVIRMVRDVDLAGYGYAAVPEFSGVFKAYGHVLSGLDGASLCVTNSGAFAGLKFLGDSDAEHPVLVSGYGVFAVVSDAGVFTDCRVDGYALRANAQNLAYGVFVGTALEGTAFTNCTVGATCSIDQGSKPNVEIGGFVGELKVTNPSGTLITFVNCTNEASIFATGDYNTAHGDGGFIGRATGCGAATTAEILFVNCADTGLVSSSGGNSNLGGYIGNVPGLTAKATCKVTFEGCTTTMPVGEKAKNVGEWIGLGANAIVEHKEYVPSEEPEEPPEEPEDPPEEPEDPPTTEQLNNLPYDGKNARFQLPTTWTWPAEDYGAEVCLWRYDRYAAVSFGHDDNCAWDVPFLLNEAEKNHIKLTWWLITDKVRDDMDVSGGGTWDIWRGAFAAGHAIESHTHTHEWKSGARTVTAAAEAAGMSVEDYVEFCMYSNSLALIREKIPGCKPCTLAYPGGEMYPEIAMKYFVSGRGVQVYINKANNTDYMNVNASALELSHLNLVLGGWGGTKTLADWRSKFNGDQQYHRGWYVPFGHTEQTKNGVAQSGHEEEVARLQEKLAILGSHRHHLWLGTYPAVAKYGQSRDTATLTVGRKAASEITFTLSDRMRDDWYDEPLTVKVRLPATWAQTGVAATQGGKTLDAFYIEHEDAKYALVNAVPDRGEVTLVPAAENSGVWDPTSYTTPNYTYQVRYYDENGTEVLSTNLVKGTSALNVAPLLSKNGFVLSWKTADPVDMASVTDDVDLTAIWTEEGGGGEEDDPVVPPEEPEVELVTNDWFNVEFEDAGYKAGSDWTKTSTDKYGGTWSGDDGEMTTLDATTRTVTLSEGFKGELRYSPSAASETDLDVIVEGTVKVSAAPRDVRPADVPVALTFEVGSAAKLTPVVYAGDGWHSFGNTGFAEGSWVNWKFELDHASTNAPRVLVTVAEAGGVVETSGWIVGGLAAKTLCSVSYVGTGSFGDFKAHYLTVKGGGEVVELVQPEFASDGSALGFENGPGEARMFTLKITNPVKGAYYTVLTSTNVEGPYLPEGDSVLFDNDGGTLTLEVSADTPQKFAKIYVSVTPISK